MKIHIGCDERYPDYYLNETGYGYEVEVDTRTLAKIRSALERYSEVQEILNNLYDAAWEKKNGKRD